MQLYFEANSNIPRDAASRLQSIAASPVAGLGRKQRPKLARALTAAVFGYDDWPALKERMLTTALGMASMVDEDCDLDALRARRAFQVSTLAKALEQHKLAGSAQDIVAAWQPSARRHQESALATKPEEWSQNGGRLAFIRLYRELHATQRFPTPAEVQQLIDGMRCANDKLGKRAAEEIGLVAVRLDNSEDLGYRTSALKLLKCLAAHGHPYAILQVAQVLARDSSKGAANQEVLQRLDAVKLAQLVERSSVTEWCITRARALLTRNDITLQREALQLIEQAADAGHAESSYNAALFYDDQPPAQFAGVVPVDIERALELYAQAVTLRYSRAMWPLLDLLQRNGRLRYVPPPEGASPGFATAYESCANGFIPSVERDVSSASEDIRLGGLLGFVVGTSLKEASPCAAATLLGWLGCQLGLSKEKLIAGFASASEESKNTLRAAYECEHSMQMREGAQA